MKRYRLGVLVGSLAISAIMAYMLRDVVHSLLVVPFYYAAWQLGVIFRAVPQLVWWTLLVVITALALAWQLVPEFRPAPRNGAKPVAQYGQVRTVAVWLQRARASTYFRWQMANRLGHLWERHSGKAGIAGESDSSNEAISSYLAAGVRLSFVDFPARRRGRANASSALDVDPSSVVSYLESQL